VRTDELEYVLPPELIAQSPAEPRDAARLLVLRRERGAVEHRRFADLPDLLEREDVVVLNTTRVLPARLRGRRPGGGGAEVLLLEPRGDGTWEALARPLRRLRPGSRVAVADGLEIEIVERLDGGRVCVRPHAPAGLAGALARAGELPLPPYIHERPADPERYQTVYAREPGSAAAPTAGLHFTPALLARLRDHCTVLELELRVGLDTFRPVAVDDLDDHPLHSEAYAVAGDARDALRAARAAGRRIVAIGTTTARVLETIADEAAPSRGRTSLKIQPGHEFRLVGALVTNFHLPRSTLLALVMAFAGVSETRRAYAEAIRERYRFYSFGDAMLVV
jgi:S-adenosylmethionine:tRNA ribosyltransferase-isomerase